MKKKLSWTDTEVSVNCKWQIMTTHGSFPAELIIK